MSDSKKYYYLKLKDNFFESDELKILQSQPDGYIYSDILLKMYLKSLQNDGALLFRGAIPYSPEMLATVTNHSVGEVKDAIQKFQSLGLVSILDNGTVFMNDIQHYVGKSSTEADRIRLYRTKLDKAKKIEDVQMYDKRTPEIRDKSLEIRDKRLDKTHSAVKPALRVLKDEFEQLWKNYPNKKDKGSAFNHYKAWRKKSVKNTNEYLEQKLADYLKYCEANKEWYHPMNGSTWFNGRFDDVLQIDEPKANKPTGKEWF
ncbi:MAG: phage replisome organizer N-terminal domain-containing protein [Liquorilactobacillus ghanensis]|uniref:phage replisome organizer N-terminal domain-containing protein n=1 Tax=Liquorilactobacillus ghanensis TaxID=399370 RepID=UPI0039ED776D